MSEVRIWTSNGKPVSLMTDVWSDRYPFGRRDRDEVLDPPGTGDQVWWMMPSARVAVLTVAVTILSATKS